MADFIRALNFPDNADDREGFRALRLALEDRQVAKLIRAAQDVLTLPRKLPEGGPVNIVGLTRDQLRAALIAAGTPEAQAKMRVGQVWQWVYHWGVRDFAAMTNLAKGYRALLEDKFTIELPQVVDDHARRDALLPGTLTGRDNPGTGYTHEAAEGSAGQRLPLVEQIDPALWCRVRCRGRQAHPGGAGRQFIECRAHRRLKGKLQHLSVVCNG
jgi:hypothetical protein